jgi:hypothetical protein
MHLHTFTGQKYPKKPNKPKKTKKNKKKFARIKNSSIFATQHLTIIITFVPDILQ